uniref:Hexose transporter 1 n=1 Tax=Fabrea salina TaxID=342563 RepID=A0A7S3I9P0_9CILI|mmetsp:Transcript_1131/g.1825  ORF Transcript_1131/g.1825 Transcript_1131/m.1825 type:complete len:145 (+) Transcript_1131:42-476(+)
MSSSHLITTYSSIKVWRVCLFASLGSFVFGYNVGVVNSTLGVVASVFNWGNHKSILTALIAGSMPLGAMVSSVFSGNFSNKIGTRGALMVSNLITLLGAVVTVIPFTITFGIGRFISGLSMGVCATLVPLTSANCSHPNEWEIR